MTSAAPGVTPLRDIWTRFAIDPLADPIASLLARHRFVTPNRVTMASGLLGAGAIVCFATGRLGQGAVLFLLRFLADCVDGKVARLQGSGSSTGALLDVATDVLCVGGAYAALAMWLVAHGDLPAATAGVLMAALATYGWALAHRKHLALLAGAGDGGSRLLESRDVRLVGGWLRLCRRLRMRPVPWTVETETLALGILPLLGAGPATEGLHVAAAFYLLATAVNLGRTVRLAVALDHGLDRGLDLDTPATCSRTGPEVSS